MALFGGKSDAITWRLLCYFPDYKTIILKYIIKPVYGVFYCGILLYEFSPNSNFHQEIKITKVVFPTKKNHLNDGFFEQYLI